MFSNRREATGEVENDRGVSRFLSNVRERYVYYISEARRVNGVLMLLAFVLLTCLDTIFTSRLYFTRCL